MLKECLSKSINKTTLNFFNVFSVDLSAFLFYFKVDNKYTNLKQITFFFFIAILYNKQYSETN